MIVFDSSVWISRLRGESSPQVAKFDRFDPNEVVLGDIVLFEILRGARDERHAERLSDALRSFTTMPMLGEGVAIAAARHSRVLRSHGVTIRKAADLLITTFCIEHGYALLHQDRDFDMIARHLDLRLA